MPVDDVSKQKESHPLLPSGEWEGFYCYYNNQQQHKMNTELMFTNSIVSGSGIDDISAFSWKGKYNIEQFNLEMTKYYTTHKVLYKGDIDENGIWGIWEISYKKSFGLIGGFHIWPKKSWHENNSNALEEQNESKKLKEIFIEIGN